MSTQERLRRPDPQRAEPIRNVTTYFRHSRSWGEVPPGEEPAAAPGGGHAQDTVDDVLAHGVSLGYKIIDEHILQGRRAAETLRNHNPGVEAGGGEAGALASRLLGLTRDVGALWYDALEIVLRSPALLSGAARPEQAAAAAAAAAAPATAISVEMASARRAQVKLSLFPGCQPAAPQVHALHAAEPGVPPLSGIHFRRAGGGLELVVEIPDAQPPATYTGVVLEQHGNEPIGTLVVRVPA